MRIKPIKILQAIKTAVRLAIALLPLSLIYVGLAQAQSGQPLTADFINPPSKYSSTASFPVTVRFSEAITADFNHENVKSNNASITSLTTTDNITHTLQVEPNQLGEAITLTIEAGVATAANDANNKNAAAVLNIPFVAPLTATFSDAPLSYTSTVPFRVVVDFSEIISADFATQTGSVVVDNASILAVDTIEANSYSIRILPSGLSDDITITIPAGVTADRTDSTNTNVAAVLIIPFRATLETVLPEVASLSIEGLNTFTPAAHNGVTLPLIITFVAPLSIDITDAQLPGAITTDDGDIIPLMAREISADRTSITLRLGPIPPKDISISIRRITLDIEYRPQPTIESITLSDPVISTPSHDGRPSSSVIVRVRTTADVSIFDRENANNGYTLNGATVNSITSESLNLRQWDFELNPSGTEPITLTIHEGATHDAFFVTNELIVDGTTNTITILYAAPPSVTSITTNVSRHNGSSSFQVTVAFDQTVLFNDTAIATNATVTGISTEAIPANVSNEFGFTVTPTGTGAIFLSIPEGAALGAEIDGSTVNQNWSNLASSAVLNRRILHSDALPGASITPNSYNSTAAIPVTVTFDQDLVPGRLFVRGDISVNGGGTFTDPIVTFGNSREYTFTLTPPNPPVDLTLTINGEPNAILYTDTTAPVVMEAFTTDLPTYVNSESTVPVPITVFFSELVTGFDTGDGSSKIDTQNATVSAITINSGAEDIDGITYATAYDFTLNPTNQDEFSFSVRQDAARDVNGNGNPAWQSNTATYDNIVPTARISGLSASINTTAAFAVTVSFSEVVTFNIANLAVPTNNATFRDFTIVTSGTLYAYTIVPNAELPAGDTLTLRIEGAVADDAGNAIPATSASTTFNPVLSRVSITAADNYSSSTTAIPITVTFDPARTFDLGDITVNGATATASNVTEITAITGSAYTFKLTPPNPAVDIIITIQSASKTITYNGLPSVSDIEVAATYNSTTAIPVAVTFAEAITIARPFGVSDIVVNGVPATAANVKNITAATATRYTFNLTPPESLGNITLNIQGVNETIVYDATAPTVVEGATTVLPAYVTAAIPIIITFSEAVTGFATVDGSSKITPTNATLSAITTSGATNVIDGITYATAYRFTLTPTNQGEFSFSVNADAARDVGNNGNPARVSTTAIYDSIVPTARISGLSASFNTTTAFEVTVSFAEVVDFTAGSLTVSPVNAAELSGFTDAGNNVYAYTLTPNTGLTVGDTITLNIAEGAVSDAAGNANPAASASTTFNPVLSSVFITAADNYSSSTTAIPITVTFDPARTFDLGDITVNGAAATATNVTEITAISGSEYTFKLTPPNPAVDIIITIQSASKTITYNGLPSVSDIEVAATYNSTTAIPVTVTFNVTPSDTRPFVIGDITVNGAIATASNVTNLSATGNPREYTFNLKPPTSLGTITLTINGVNKEIAYQAGGLPEVQTIHINRTAFTTTAAIQVTVIFAETPSDARPFVIGDITLNNGATASDLSKIATKIYTFDFTPPDALPTQPTKFTVTINDISASTMYFPTGNAIDSHNIPPTHDGTPFDITITFLLPVNLTVDLIVDEFADFGSDTFTVENLIGSGRTWDFRINPLVNDLLALRIDSNVNGEFFDIEFTPPLPPLPVVTSITFPTSTYDSRSTTIAIPVTVNFEATPGRVFSSDDIIVLVDGREFSTFNILTEPIADDEDDTIYRLFFTPIPYNSLLGNTVFNSNEAPSLNLKIGETTSATLRPVESLPRVTSVTLPASYVTAAFDVIVNFDQAPDPTKPPFNRRDIDITVNGVALQKTGTFFAIGEPRDPTEVTPTQYTFKMTPNRFIEDTFIFTVNGTSSLPIVYDGPAVATAVAMIVDGNTLTAPNNPHNGNAFDIRVTYSEPVTIIPGATPTAVAATAALGGYSVTVNTTDADASDNQITYTVTPIVGTTQNIVFRLPNIVRDASLATADNSRLIIPTIPYATATLTDPETHDGSPFDATLEFSAEVLDLRSQLTIVRNTTPNDNFSNNSSSITSEDNLTWTFDFVPKDAADGGNTPISGTLVFGDNYGIADLPFSFGVAFLSPIAGIVVAATYNSTAAIPVTVNFAEAPTTARPFVIGDIVVNGTEATEANVKNITAATDTQYTFNLTPPEPLGNITLTINGENATIVYNSPAAPIVLTTTVLPEHVNSTNAIPIIVTFSERVTGFVDENVNSSNIAPTNATLSAITINSDSDDSIVLNGETYASVYSFTLSPTNQGDFSFTVIAGAAQDVGGQTNLARGSTTGNYDNTPPIARISGLSASLNTTAAFAVTVSFEEVVDFTAGSLTVSTGNAELSGFDEQGNVYAYTLTPNTELTAGATITLNIAAGAVSDDASNANLAATASTTFNPVLPSVATITAANSYSSTLAIPVTVTFTRAPSTALPFVLGDVFVNGTAATADNVTNLTVTGNPLEYKFDLTPPDTLADITITISGTNSNVITYIAPLPSVSDIEVAATYNSTTAIPVAVTFAEVLTTARPFGVSDIVVNGVPATADNVKNITAATTTRYTFNLTPPESLGNITLNIQGVNETIVYDATAPTVVEGATTVLPAYVTAAIPIIITFSEAVTGFATVDGSSKITPTNATLSAITTSGATNVIGGITYATAYRFTLTPTNQDEFSFSVNANAARDVGNNGNPARVSTTAIYDSIAPTARISGLSASFNTTAAFAVTVSFEEVVDFTAGSLTVSPVNAAELSGFTDAGNNVYAYTLTPNTGLTIGDTITLNIAEGAVSDAAGNANPAASAAATFTSDSSPPTASIDDLPATIATTAAFDITVTFNEPVNGFNQGDLTASTSNTDATFSGFTNSGGNAYAVTVTPNANLAAAATITVTLVADAVTDLADNANTAAVLGSTTFNPVLPAVSTIAAANSYSSTTAIPVTVTFTRAPSTALPFVIGDIRVNNIAATADNVTNLTVTTGNPLEYKFNLTPPTPPADITITISGTNSNVITYNAPVAPGVRFLVGFPADRYNDTTFSTTVPLAIVATFDRAVSGFGGAEDIAAINAASTNVAVTAIVDNGDATGYTLTVTPDSVITDNIGANNTLTFTLMIPAGLAQADGLDNTASLPITTMYDDVKPVFTLAFPLQDYVTFTGSGSINPSPGIIPSEITTLLLSSHIEVVGFATFIPRSLSPLFYQVTYLANSTVQGEISFTILANRVFDDFGNGNLEARFTSIFDTISPVPTLEGVPPIRTTNTATPFEVTTTFNEPINEDNAFTIDDISVGNNTATLDNFIALDDGLNYTFRVTPNINNPGDITITIRAAAVRDLARNDNAVFTQTSRFDNTPPTILELQGVTPLRNSIDSFNVTAVFSEPVDGFTTGEDATSDNADIIITAVDSLDGFATNYTLAVTPTGAGPVTITIPANAAQDEANFSNATGIIATSGYDSEAPIVANIRMLPTTISTTVPFEITIGFSEPVTGFTAADITADNATFSGGDSDGVNTYRVTVTPNANLADGDTITLNIAANAVTDAAANANVAAVLGSTTFSPVLPTVSAITADSYSSTATIPVTVTFARAPSSARPFRITDIMVNGTAASSGNATTPTAPSNALEYKFNLTPPNGLGDITININGFPATIVFDRSGDTIAPTVLSTTNLPTYVNSDTTLPIPITVTFSERVTGFVSGDVNTTNATISAFTTSGETSVIVGETYATAYSFTLTPTTQGEFRFSVNAGAAQDVGNNDTNAVAVQISTYDSRAPIARSNLPGNIPTTAAFDITVTFEEPVIGFVASDLTVSTSNATLGGITDNGDNTYTVTLTPSTTLAANATITLNIAAGAVTDVAGNANPVFTATTTFTERDITRPTFSFVNGPTAPRNNLNQFTVTAEFNEPVTGFETGADATATNATVTIAPIDTMRYTLTVTPTAAGEIVITIPNDAAMDAENNGNVAGTITLPYDADAPTPSFENLPATHNDADTDFTVIVNFREDVSGFESADVTATNAAVPTVTPIDNRRYTLTVNPDGVGDVMITINAGAATDSAGNNSAVAVSDAVRFDNTPPTVDAFDDVLVARNNNIPFTVTATFSELVTGLTTGADVTATNAAVIAVSPVTITAIGPQSYATAYTLLVDPNDNGEVTITIAAGAVQDEAGNSNAEAVSMTSIFDNEGPIVSFADVHASVSNLDAFEITARFSEDVDGFTDEDITVVNATVEITNTVLITDGTETYTLTVTPDGNGNITITIPADAAMDLSGNGNAGPVSADTIIYDAAPPSIRSISGLSANLNSTASFDLTVVFNEPVGGLEASEVAATNITVNTVTAQSPDSSGLSDTYMLNVTPNGNAGLVQVIIPANVAEDAAENGNTASSPANSSYDADPPTVSLSRVPSSYSGTTEITGIMVSFNEAVTGFATGDVSVTTANASVTVSGSGDEYRLTVDPDGSNTDITLVINAGVAQDAAGNSNTASVSHTVTWVLMDNTPPTVSLRSDVLANTNTGFTVNATFSEPVSGFTASDVSVANDNASVSNVSAAVSNANGTETYTFTVTPVANGAVSISIPAGVANDTSANRNLNEASTNIITTTYDNRRPLVSLTSDVPAITNAGFNVTAEFSEPVNFTVSDVITTNASVTLSGSGRIYTIAVTPSSDGVVTISIPAGMVLDDATNSNTASNPITRTYDATRPTVILSELLARLSNTSPTTRIMATFSEPVSGFMDSDDVDIINARVSNVSAAVSNADGTETYTLTITPNGTAGMISITVPVNVAQDAARNGNEVSNTVTSIFDADRPGVTLTSSVATSTNTGFTVNATFSEPVSGFTASDVSVANDNASVSNVSAAVSNANGTETYTFTVTPNGTDGTISVSIAANRVTDASGNQNTASGNAISTLYDDTAPTVTLDGDDGAPTAVNSTAPFTVKVEFSEAVVGLTAGEVTISNASVTTVSGSGAEYTLTVTPDGNDGAITISLLAGVAQDIAGNDSLASTTATITYDATPPVINSVLTAGGAPDAHNGPRFAPVTVAVIFSEDVSGLTDDDIEVVNGTVEITNTVLNQDGTETYTLVVTPTATADITITIPEGAVEDIAGNNNTAPSLPAQSLTLTYRDIIRPTVNVTFADGANNLTAHNGTDDFVLIATFSEAVTGFDSVDDVVIDTNNASVAISAIAASNGASYTLTVTPTDTSVISITIPENAAQDLAETPNNSFSSIAPTIGYRASTVTVIKSPPEYHDGGSNPDPAESTFEFILQLPADITTLSVAGQSQSGQAEATLSASNVDPQNVIVSNTGSRFTIRITPDREQDIAIGLSSGAVILYSTAVRFNTPLSVNSRAAATTDLVTGRHDGSTPFTVTLTFGAEAVVGGFGDNGDVTASNAVVGTITIAAPESNDDGTGDVTARNAVVSTIFAPEINTSHPNESYAFTVTPNDNSRITLVIPEDAYQSAGAGNLAYDLITIDGPNTTTVADATASFLLSRANKLIANQPGLTRFIRAGDLGSYRANATQNAGSAAGFILRGNTWAEVTGTWSSNSSYVLGTIGAHRFVKPNLLVGGMVQSDSIDEDIATYDASGSGWLAGPYFVLTIPNQNYHVEGRLLYGQSDNKITLTGNTSDTSEFETDRWLVQSRATGEYVYGRATLMPSLDLTYAGDAWKAYRNGDTLIPADSVSLMQVSAGMEVGFPVRVDNGGLNLTGGITGIYSASDGGTTSSDGGRGRAKLGLNYDGGKGITVGVGTFYDGIGSDYEGYGANLNLGIRF